MHSEIEYRGYGIFHDGYEFVAEPKVGDGSLFEIGTHSIELAMATIDEMFSYLDTVTSVSMASDPPAWFQTWVDNGAAGRVRILGQRGFELEHLNRTPKHILKRRKKHARRLAVASCAMVVAATGYVYGDIDGDGSITSEDVAILIDHAHMHAPRRTVIRTVEIGGNDYMMIAVPSLRDEVDYHVKLVAAFKQTP